MRLSADLNSSASHIALQGGGGGGSESTGSDFVQKPDTLRSTDTFEGLLGLCIGPIKGPVNGLKSVRVNGTPIMDASGNTNFQDFTAAFADGDPLKFPQKVSLRLGSAGAPDAVNVQLRNIGGSAPVWVTRTVNNLNADAIDLRFIVQQLYGQSESGIFEETMTLDVEMKPVGTTTWIKPLQINSTPPAYSDDGFEPGEDYIKWYMPQTTYLQSVAPTAPGTFQIRGKTTSPYVKEFRIKVPSTGVYADKGWDIRVRLVETESLDNDPEFEKRTVTWESVTAVYNDVIGDHEDWRGVAWLQLYGKASDVLTGVPEVDGIYETKIVQVPPSSVYNPLTRTYTGATWNGSYVKSYTNDPAWCINDAISDSLSGLARVSPGAHLNKWDALELSKYCSEQVSDGDGGQHSRFSMNLVISEAQRSDEFIRYMAGACGATAWDTGNGEWRVMVDKPRNPVALFTHENIEGEFQYSHTDIDTRFNDYTVVFANEEFDYREDRVRVEDTVHIAKYGRKPTKVVAVGCTHRQQAVRWAILKMRTSVNEWRAVSFITNRQGKYIERFDWILVADGELALTAEDLKRTTGRIIKKTGDNVVEKTAADGWNELAYGDLPVNSVTFKFDVPGTKHQQIGLCPVGSETVQGAGGSDAQLWGLWAGPGTLGVVHTDGGFSDLTTLGISTTADDVWTLSYTDDGTFHYEKNGVEVFSHTVAPGARDLRFKHRGLTQGAVGRILSDVGDVIVTGGSYGVAATQIRLRDTVRLETGLVYKLKATVPNPNYNPDSATFPTHADWAAPTIVIERTIVNTPEQRGDVRDLYLDLPLPANCAENANVALDTPTLPSVPKVYRVVDVSYADDGERVTINAIEVDTAKFVASDTANYNYHRPGYPNNGGGGGGSGGTSKISSPIEPEDGMWTLTTFKSTYEGTRNVLTANWDRPPEPTFDKFRVQYRHNRGDWQDKGFTTDDFFEIVDPPVGKHELQIYALDTAGRVSKPLKGDYEIDKSPRAVAISLGPALIVAQYDSTGTVAQDLPKNTLYKLASNGADVDATWQYRVTDGGVNGFTPASSWKTMTNSGIAGIFALTSVEVPDSVVEIRGTYRKMSASISVAIDKTLAGEDSSGGPTGATTLTQASGFTGIATPGTSYVPITNEFNLPVASGQSVSAVVALQPKMPASASNLGPWNIQYKLQREVGGVWTDVGAVQNSNPDPETVQEWVDPYDPFGPNPP